MAADEIRLVPPTVVTVTPTTPAVSAGDTALIDVALFTTKLAALVEPNLTPDAPLKFVPLMVTVVPPPTGPPAGERPVTVGAGV